MARRCVGMRLAVVSDIHGHLAALEAVIDDLKRQAPDLVVHGGDLAVIGPRPSDAIDLLRHQQWPGVLGNTDQALFDRSVRLEQEERAPKLHAWLGTLFDTLVPWTLAQLRQDQIEWLRQLPRIWRMDRVAVLHASPGDLWRAPLPDATDDTLRSVYGGLAEVAVYGHIHRPYIRELGELTVANTGSVGLPYDGDPRASYLLIDRDVVRVRRVVYDLERSTRDLIAVAFPLAEWLASVQRGGRFATPPRRAGDRSLPS